MRDRKANFGKWTARRLADPETEVDNKSNMIAETIVVVLDKM